ncbi:hypothetical protein [Seonamhaeicola sp. ML3]|uniref:hypothetical protein n=1 Tax=Seonamhaeicola sp. ML3 TaxID=2937786 RepID=UPI00200CC111|nr:hypothetical protein [Seonamhaeicola sp. ML3]
MKELKDKLKLWPLNFVKKNPKTTLWILGVTLPLCLLFIFAILFNGGRIKYKEYIDIDTRNIEIVDTIKVVEYDTINKIVYDTITKEVVRTITKKRPSNNITNGSNSNFGTNSGIIGDNGTINNFGEKPITLSLREKQIIQDSLNYYINSKLDINKRINLNIEQSSGNIRSYEKSMLISEYIFGKNNPNYGKLSTYVTTSPLYKKFVFKVNPADNSISIMVGNY